MTTGRGFRCGGGDLGRNTSVILPPEHVGNVSRRYVSRDCMVTPEPQTQVGCDKASQRRHRMTSNTNGNQNGGPTAAIRRRRNGPNNTATSNSSLTLSSPTALLSSAPEWQAQFYKTKLCPFYVQDIPDAATAQQLTTQYGHNIGCATGVCINHDACRFAHCYEELRPLPDLRQTKLCSSYTKKTPCKNPKCPFAHSPRELRTSSSVFYKVTLCNFYKNGRCWNGSNCRFAHGNDELRTSSSQTTSSEAPPSIDIEIEEDDINSSTTASTRTKKRRPASSRSNDNNLKSTSDGLLPTPSDCSRISIETKATSSAIVANGSTKVCTAATTAPNSTTSTPPGSVHPVNHHQPSVSFLPDAETLLNLVTQKLLEPPEAAPNSISLSSPSQHTLYIPEYSSPQQGPPGFNAEEAVPGPFSPSTTEAFVQLLLSATNGQVANTDQHQSSVAEENLYPRTVSRFQPPDLGYQQGVVYNNQPAFPTLFGEDQLYDEQISAPLVNNPPPTVTAPCNDCEYSSQVETEEATVRLLVSLLQGMGPEEQTFL